MIAFLTWLADGIGPESRYVHLGMTSSDVLDTCLSVQLVQATDLLAEDLDAVLDSLRARAELLERARAHAEAIVAADPQLQTPEHALLAQALREHAGEEASAPIPA